MGEAIVALKLKSGSERKCVLAILGTYSLEFTIAQIQMSLMFAMFSKNVNSSEPPIREKLISAISTEYSAEHQP